MSVQLETIGVTLTSVGVTLLPDTVQLPVEQLALLYGPSIIPSSGVTPPSSGPELMDSQYIPALG